MLSLRTCIRGLTLLATVFFLPASLRAGYEQPCFIDGCQSSSGRFTIAAEPAGKILNHGPNQWTFVWSDKKTGETRKFPAQGISRGQIFAQLFIAPDGETFALFNHVTLWYADKSDMHGATKLWGEKAGYPKDIKQEAFSRRIIVYKKDGSILKELGICDMLNQAELDNVMTVFTRVHWLEGYANLNYRKTARPAYAFCQVSPDYTVLEVRAVSPRGSKDKSGRPVRVSLTSGQVLEDAAKLAPEQTPVRAFVGPDHLPDDEPKTRESFVPSIDPVRVASKLTWSAPVPSVELKLVKGGFKKLDTPAWLAKENCLLFTDLDENKLYRLDSSNAITEVRAESVRGKVGPDGVFFGVFAGKLASWKLGAEPAIVLDKASNGGPISMNDLAISGRGRLYFTTLKDPERGRLTVVDLKTKSALVAFDGNDHPDWSNPNGVAVTADGKHLIVAISNYKNRKHAGLYRLPIRDDGSLDLAAGKKRWANPAAPDGVTIGPDGLVYCTDGNVIRIYDEAGSEVAKLKIPQGSGTNLTFGGPEGRTLFVTTQQALFVGNWQGKAEVK